MALNGGAGGAGGLSGNFATAFGGNGTNWLIMKNGPHLIGLFQGMFEKNMLTFNPGWDAAAQNVDPFTDVRQLQAMLTAAGVTLDSQVDPAAASGPGFFTITDPDGNPILVDQHR
jgi:hypothetical protein